MSPRVEAFEYWTHIAYKKPEARALATRLGLDVPQGTMQGYKCGLIYPMRRLVISGEDSSANMAILFGSSWESVDEMHKECRKQVLMAPPLQGSPMGKMSGFWDEGSVRWTPRPASEEEEAALAEQRHFNRIFQGYGL